MKITVAKPKIEKIRPRSRVDQTLGYYTKAWGTRPNLEVLDQNRPASEFIYANSDIAKQILGNFGFLGGFH